MPEKKYTITEDLPYGAHERQKADIFIPNDPKSLSGILFFIHGGGWTVGDKADYRGEIDYYCNLGYICSSISYRYVDGKTLISDQLDDITESIGAIKKKCAELGFNIEKLIFIGASAGSHLALLHAYTRKNEAAIPAVAACLYCPPVYCYEDDFISGNLEGWRYDVLSKCCGIEMNRENFLSAEPQEALKQISPALYVSPDCIPTAIFHGTFDEIIPIEHAERFIEKLCKTGVKNEFLVFPNSTHALDKDPDIWQRSRDITVSHADRYF